MINISQENDYNFMRVLPPERLQNKFDTLGLLLLIWGFEPRELGLKKEQLANLQTCLQTIPGVKSEWLEDAPWRIWNHEHVWSGIIYCLILG